MRKIEVHCAVETIKDTRYSSSLGTHLLEDEANPSQYTKLSTLFSTNYLHSKGIEVFHESPPISGVFYFYLDNPHEEMTIDHYPYDYQVRGNVSGVSVE